MRKQRNCVKRDRPEWWTPEEVLRRLQDGQYVGLICKEGAAEVEEEVSAKTLRADVSQWAESATWGEQFRAALKILRPDGKGGITIGKDWYEEFFVAMEACEGEAELACEACGVSYGIVLALLDRRNKCHDRDFAERFRIAEAPRIGKVRSKYFKHATDGEGNPKVQEKILESHLPHMHSGKQEVHVSGGVDVTHGMSPAMSAAVMAASQNRTRALFSGREPAALPAHDGGQLIDITPVRQKASA